MLNLRSTPANSSVASFLVQAGSRPRKQSKTRRAVLVRHLLSRFQADDTGDEENNLRRTLFFCATSALPPVFVAVMLYPAYHPLTLVPMRRPYLSQIGDEYLYVLYAFLAMGIACIALWESIFPDLLDVFALALLPLSPGFLMRCRAIALLIFFGVILLCIAGPGSILLPAIVEGPSVPRHLVAHASAAFAAGIFSCTSLIALQSMLEITFGARTAKRLTPPLQTFALLALFSLLGLTPSLLHHLQQPAFLTSTLVRTLPTFWFLGIYEQIRGGSRSLPGWNALALRGWIATGCVLCAAGLTYPIAYHRRSLFLVQSGNAAAGNASFPSWCQRILHRVLLRTPASRATFHMVAQTSFRAPKVRSTLSVYLGLGLALVLSVAARDLPLSAVIIGGATVAGLHSVVRKRFMPRAAWLFQLLPPTAGSHVQGTLRIAACWGTLASLLFLLVRIATAPQLLHQERPALLIALATALCMPVLLGTVLFFNFSAFPFTTEPESSPERFVAQLLACVILVPAALFAFHVATLRAERTWLGVALFMATMLGVSLLVQRVHRERSATTRT